MTFTDIVSTLGVFFILLAFFLNTFNRLRSDSKLYFILNMLGAALAFWGSILLHSVPFAVLEGLWFVVALIGFIKSYQRS